MKRLKVETWLPVFSGFYGTIWEGDREEELEIDGINEKREELGLSPVEWDAVEFDYEGYMKDVCERLTRYIGEELKRKGLIAGYRFQSIRSPREYNFTNDAVDVEYTLVKENVRAIGRYLMHHRKAFEEYVKETYTSRSGFVSSYSNDAGVWLKDIQDTVTHRHKLGSVLNFILLNEDDEIEVYAYEQLSGNGVTVQALNYAQLTTKDEKAV
jgi:hypothetical protein